MKPDITIHRDGSVDIDPESKASVTIIREDYPRRTRIINNSEFSVSIAGDSDGLGQVGSPLWLAAGYELLYVGRA